MAFRHPKRAQQACGKQDEAAPAPSVMDLDDLRQTLEAQRARLDADRSAITSERERILREAEERGYRDGQTRARQDFEQTAKPVLLGLIEDLRARTDALDHMLREADEKIIALICAHAVALAKRLVGAHYDVHPDSITKGLAPLLRDAAAEHPAGHEIVCTAHPQTLRQVSSVAGDLAASGLILSPDDTMQPGGAKLVVRDVDTNRTIAEWDATIERRFANLGAVT